MLTKNNVKMSIRELNITVYEGGSVYHASNYSGQEMAALIEAIEDLWSPTYLSMRLFNVVFTDDDQLKLVYEDVEMGTYLPIPNEWMKKKITVGRKRDLALVGDRIPIMPRQFGLSPWPDSVEVKFVPE